MSKYRITALKLQKQNRQRVTVFLDGEYAFGLDRLVAAWLSVGQELDDHKIAQLKAEDEREIAYQQALNLINYRLRSEQEVRSHLNKKKVNEEIIDATIHRLKKSGLLNDETFAREWVENRSEFHPRGLKALTYELRQKGICEEVIDKVLEGIDEKELGLRTAVRQAPKYKALDWQEFRQKMFSHLSRKGFNYGVVSEIVPQVWAKLHEKEDEKG